MSAYTSAICYRAGGDPPIVTAADLACFSERILALDILQSDVMTVELKFGQAIDQDDRSTNVEEELGPGLFLMQNYDWDIEGHRLSHADALELLHHPPTSRQVTREKKHLLDVIGSKIVTEQFGPHIYRAFLDFNLLKEELTHDLCHQLQGNYLFLSNLSFSIDLVELNDPEEVMGYQVGWMEFSVSGNGYLFPWTYEETLEKLRRHPMLNQVRDLCREMWPATSTPPRPEIIANRPQMGKLWAEPVDAPFDWYWAINESY